MLQKHQIGFKMGLPCRFLFTRLTHFGQVCPILNKYQSLAAVVCDHIYGTQNSQYLNFIHITVETGLIVNNLGICLQCGCYLDWSHRQKGSSTVTNFVD